MAWSVEIDAGMAGFSAKVDKMARLYGTATSKMEANAQRLADVQGRQQSRLTALVVDAERDRETAVVRIHRETAAKLAQIDDMAQGGPRTAQQAAAALSIQARSARDLATAMRPAATATVASAVALQSVGRAAISGRDAFGALSRQIPDVLTQLQMGTPVFTIATQQGLQMVDQLGGIMPVMGAIVAAAGPYLLAIGAIGAAGYGLYRAYKADNAELKELDEKLETVQGTLDPKIWEDAARAADGFATSVRSVSFDAAILAGNLTTTEAAISREVEAMREKQQVSISAHEAAIAELSSEREIQEARIASREMNIDDAHAARARITEIDGLIPRHRILAGQLREIASAQAEEIQDVRTGTAEHRAASGAIREETQARSAYLSIVQQESAANSVAIAGWIAFSASARGAAEVLLSDEERIRAETDRTTAAIIARGEALGETARAAQYVADVQVAADQRIQEIGARAAAESQKKAEDAIARRLALEQSARDQTLSGTSTLLTSVSSLTQQAGEKGFTISKGLATGAALIDGITAIQKTYAQLGFPLGIPAAMVMGGITLANIAKINQVEPQYYAGLPTSYETSPYPATLDRGERVLTNASRSALSDDQVRSANRGQKPTAAVSHVWLDGRELSASMARDEARVGRIRTLTTRPQGHHADQ